MSNPECAALMEQQLQHARQPSLLIVDENIAPDRLHPAQPHAGQHIITNRWDIATALRQQGATVTCNDFEFESLRAAAPRSVLYRISKEKAVVHHIINRSAELLPAGGELILLGHKQEGLLSYGKRATRYLGGDCHATRGAKGYTALRLQRSEHLGEPLPDDNYPNLRRCIDVAGLSLFSKPGIYGWQKVDRGSMLLLEALQQITPAGGSTALGGDILDLGCGYGLLSVLAARQLSGHFIATDNNYAAIAACSRNFAAYQVSGEVIADDCARNINRHVDLVLCNPPFHQGFATSQEITARFIEQAARHLKAGGCALFVVNQFVAIERHAATRFGDCRELLRRDGFKILLLRQPRPCP